MIATYAVMSPIIAACLTISYVVAGNRELAESKAAIVRSAHRSELIFAALSEA